MDKRRGYEDVLLKTSKQRKQLKEKRTESREEGENYVCRQPLKQDQYEDMEQIYNRLTQGKTLLHKMGVPHEDAPTPVLK